MRMLVFAFGLMAASACANATTADSKCKYTRITELPVWIEDGRPVTVGSLNGRKVGILLDTGSGPSVLHRSAIEMLGLAGFGQVSLRPFGGGGEIAANTVQIDEFRLGRTVRKGWRVLVSGDSPFGRDIALTLGYEFFRNVDVEFDFPGAAMRLYQAEHCDQARLSYWTSEPANELPLERGSQLRLALQINGHPVRAQLDSGASHSVIESDLASRLGMTPRSPGVAAGGCSAGLGANPVDTWIGQFETLSIGEERIRNPKIRIGELWKDVVDPATPRELQRLPEMLLGVDFLRSHRVLVAHSQRKIYFTYSGGTVFPPAATANCGTRS